jgi:hypothetical protein
MQKTPFQTWQNRTAFYASLYHNPFHNASVFCEYSADEEIWSDYPDVWFGVHFWHAAEQSLRLESSYSSKMHKVKNLALASAGLNRGSMV